MILESKDPIAFGFKWNAIHQDGARVGDLTTATWSYRLKKNIGFALIARSCKIGDRVEIQRDGGVIAGTLTDLPFIAPA